MDTSKVEKNGRIYMLTHDAGFEHGPTDFNDYNYDSGNIIKLAIEGGATCVTMQYGTAKRFYTPEYRKQIPLILKLNGKTNLYTGNTTPALMAGVEEALALGAVGVGMTINPGQVDEDIAFEQFAAVRREAEKAGLIMTAWSYARGPEITNQFDPKVVAYAARVAMELGADIIKVKYTGDPESFAWAVKNACGAKVIASGTDNFPKDYVPAVAEMLKSGAHGIAVGRNVWQAENPLQVSKALAEALF